MVLTIATDGIAAMIAAILEADEAEFHQPSFPVPYLPVGDPEIVGLGLLVLIDDGPSGRPAGIVGMGDQVIEMLKQFGRQADMGSQSLDQIERSVS